MKTELKHGEQAQIARLVKITARHMNDIIKGRKRASPKLAEKLERETGIPAEAWVFPEKHQNPLINPPQEAAVEAAAN